MPARLEQAGRAAGVRPAPPSCASSAAQHNARPLLAPAGRCTHLFIVARLAAAARTTLHCGVGSRFAAARRARHSMSQAAEPPDAQRNAIVRACRLRALLAPRRAAAIQPKSWRSPPDAARAASPAAPRACAAQIKTAAFVAANGQVFEQRCVAAQPRKALRRFGAGRLAPFLCGAAPLTRVAGCACRRLPTPSLRSCSRSTSSTRISGRRCGRRVCPCPAASDAHLSGGRQSLRHRRWAGRRRPASCREGARSQCACGGFCARCSDAPCSAVGSGAARTADRRACRARCARCACHRGASRARRAAQSCRARRRRRAARAGHAGGSPRLHGHGRAAGRR